LWLNVLEKHSIHIPNIIYHYNSYQDLDTKEKEFEK
jgi:hypothetical protein